MPDKPLTHVCPYLGLPNDRPSHYREPSDAHRCYSPGQPGIVDFDHQEAVCFSSKYTSCQRFVPLAVVESAADASSEEKAVAAHNTAAKTKAAESSDADRPPRRFGFGNALEVALWGLAVVLGVFAIYSAWPLFVPQGRTSALAVATREPFPTSIVTATPEPSSTVAPTSTTAPLPTLAPLAIPTPPSDGMVLTLPPDANETGWVASNELDPHWGDRNLQVGSFQNQTYSSVLQFTLADTLPPGSKILFAALEITASDATYLGRSGQWGLELMARPQTKDWAQASAEDVARAAALASIGRPLGVSELSVGSTNRFEFDQAQLRLLEQQLVFGQVTFRIKADNVSGDDLFAWDAGSGGALTGPTLYLVAVPAPFTVVTNTPTPENVLTAAADVIRATAFARQYGTATPFPPGVITATPGGGSIRVPLGPTPANAATVEFRSALATAIAITTGTYTPTPQNVVIVNATVTPAFVSIDRLNALPTPTAGGAIDYSAIPIPAFLRANIVALTNRFGSTVPMVVDPEGKVLGALSGDTYYRAALARENLSPDRLRQATYLIDRKGRQQIALKDLQTGALTQVTNIGRGIAYDVVWAPDGGSLAYVSTETRGDEIYVYDLGTKSSRRLTDSSGLGFPFNKHPSWSPDSQRIVFWSSRTGHSEIWVVDRTGQNLKDISNSSFDDSDPVWVK